MRLTETEMHLTVCGFDVGSACTHSDNFTVFVIQNSKADLIILVIG